MASVSTEMSSSSSSSRNGQDFLSSEEPNEDESSRRKREIDASSLKVLDWISVLHHVSIFTATKLGRNRCYDMEVGSDLSRSLRLQDETRAVYSLEAELGKRIEFRGVDSTLVESALRRTENGGRLSPELFNSILTLSVCMSTIQSLVKSTYQSQKGSLKERLEPLLESVQDLSCCPQLRKDIRKIVDEDNNVRDHASQTLSKLRNQIRVLERRILSQVRSKGDTPTTHKGRVCLEIYSSDLPKYEKNFLLIGNAESGGMVYVEPASVISMNNNLMELRGQESAEIETICWKLSEKIYEELEELQRLFEVLIQLDVTVARARYTISVNGNWPQLVEPARQVGNEKFTVRLKQLRNPLLLWEERKAQFDSGSKKKKMKNKADKAKKPVPVDIFVEKGVSAIVITGPNTGGKTACMKALGIVSLMSRSGLGIPASGSVILPAFDNVYADIGDEQSLGNNLSTFSSHIKHIQNISEHCTKRSLILLDELGTGTDPVEGSALGTAIMKNFLERAFITISTTHFSHISSLKYVDSRVENAAVDFDPETLKPTYQIVWGASGQSNAFHIAKSLGLQGDILEAALEIAGEDAADSSSGSTDLASTLEDLKASINDSSFQVRRNLMQTRLMYENGSEALQSLRTQQLKDNQEKTQPRVHRLLEDSRLRVKEITKRESSANKKNSKLQKNSPALNSKMSKLVTKVQKKEKSKRDRGIKVKQMSQKSIAAGSTVFIPQFKKKAVVLSVLGSEMLVQMGVVKMKVRVASVQQIG